MDMRQLVPDEIYGWKTRGAVEAYDRKTIFDYIDGAGEVYLQYDFRKVMVFRLVKADEPTIFVELFDMGTSEDAYGVFTHGYEGGEQDIGQGSEYRGGVVCFWKSHFFVCVFSERETPESKKAVFDLAKKISEKIKVDGAKPKLVEYLPPEGLLKQSVRYFHKHTSLNYHYFVATQNILNLSPQTEAVLARYQPRQSWLLCIRYQSPEEAKQAYSSFINSYIPEGKKSGLAQIENGKWVGVKLEGRFVTVVFDAPTIVDAQTLLDSVRHKLLQSTLGDS